MSNSLDMEFPSTKKLIYLDSAAIGVCPVSTIRVIEGYVKGRCDYLQERVVRGECVDRWTERANVSKKLFARIIGAKEDEVASVPSTTIGINTVFSMLPLNAGENLVTTDMSIEHRISRFFEDFPIGKIYLKNRSIVSKSHV